MHHTIDGVQCDGLPQLIKQCNKIPRILDHFFGSKYRTFLLFVCVCVCVLCICHLLLGPNGYLFGQFSDIRQEFGLAGDILAQHIRNYKAVVSLVIFKNAAQGPLCGAKRLIDT